MDRLRQTGLLRDDSGRGHQVTSIELFFDLVYVFAVTQLSHFLLDHLDVVGALHAGLLLMAVWIAWIYTAWLTNWLDPERRAVRGALLALMAASLVMSAALPNAFGELGLLFAVAYAAMEIGRGVFAVWAMRGHPALRRNYQRILAWQMVSGLLWLAGGAASGSARLALWVTAVVVISAGPLCGFATSGLGRSTTRDWTISGELMAERSQLFLIIALGESILVTGATFSAGAVTLGTGAAFAIAFLGSVALWWVYFDRSAGDAEAAIAHADDPGDLGRSAYTYLHLPMVAGIIVAAVGDELTISHPLEHAHPGVVATVLGGPALFLAGHALFKRAVFGAISASRLAAVGALAVIAVLGRDWPPLALTTAAVAIVTGVAWWDARKVHGRQLAPQAGRAAAPPR